MHHDHDNRDQPPHDDHPHVGDWILVGLIVLLLFMLTGCDDAEIEEQTAQEYCTNVHAGYWPDYNHNYRDICDSEGNHVRDK